MVDMGGLLHRTIGEEATLPLTKDTRRPTRIKLFRAFQLTEHAGRRRATAATLPKEHLLRSLQAHTGTARLPQVNTDTARFVR